LQKIHQNLDEDTKLIYDDIDCALSSSGADKERKKHLKKEKKKERKMVRRTVQYPHGNTNIITPDRKRNPRNSRNSLTENNNRL